MHDTARETVQRGAATTSRRSEWDPGSRLRGAVRLGQRRLHETVLLREPPRSRRMRPPAEAPAARSRRGFWLGGEAGADAVLACVVLVLAMIALLAR